MAKTKYESSKKAIKKYIAEKTDDIRLRVPKGTKDRWKEYAKAKGISLTRFVANVVEEAIQRDNTLNTDTILAIREVEALKKDTGKKVYASFSEILEELEEC